MYKNKLVSSYAQLRQFAYAYACYFLMRIEMYYIVY